MVGWYEAACASGATAPQVGPVTGGPDAPRAKLEGETQALTTCSRLPTVVGPQEETERRRRRYSTAIIGPSRTATAPGADQGRSGRDANREAPRRRRRAGLPSVARDADGARAGTPEPEPSRKWNPRRRATHRIAAAATALAPWRNSPPRGHSPSGSALPLRPSGRDANREPTAAAGGLVMRRGRAPEHRPDDKPEKRRSAAPGSMARTPRDRRQAPPPDRRPPPACIHRDEDQILVRAVRDARPMQIVRIDHELRAVRRRVPVADAVALGAHEQHVVARVRPREQ